MTVSEMMNTHISKFNFIVADATGKCIFDELTGSFIEYNKIRHKEVKKWGVHNKKDKTFVLYI